MKTLLSILVLLVATPAFAQFRLAFTNAIYISHRDDGRPGLGTVTDPYNGSTPSRLEQVLSNAAVGATVFFYPSTNYTIRLSSGATNYWQPKNGQTFVGLGGKDAVKITASTNTVLHANKVAFFYSGGVTNVTVTGITFDNNIDYFNRFATSNSWTNLSIGAGHVSEMSGDNIEFNNCRIQGFWGGFSNSLPNASEGFPVYLGSTAPLITNYNQTFIQYKGNRLLDCEILNTNDYYAIWNYAFNVVFGGYSGAGSNAAGVYQSNRWKFGRSIARGNRLISSTNAHGLNFGAGTGQIIENNTVLNGRLTYFDTYMVKDLIVRNNYVTAPRTNQILMDFNLTTNSLAGYVERAEEITIADNVFDASRAKEGPYSELSEAIIRFSSIPITNSIGQEPVCASNITVSGNLFIGSSNSALSGFTGQVKDGRFLNNTFKNIGRGMEFPYVMDDVLISGNHFENVGFGLLNLQYATIGSPVRRRDVTITGNSVKNVNRYFFEGGADNLLIEGNTIHDYSLFAPGVATEQSAAIRITTNGPYNATMPRRFTNVVIKDNILWNHTNATGRDYSIQMGGVNNFTIVDNPHNANNGVVLGMHGSSETYGGTRQIIGDTIAVKSHSDPAVTNVGLYATVQVGNTNFYVPLLKTNLLDLGTGGGENTLAGTNLVMVGSTISLANNPLILGPTSTNATAISAAHTIRSTSTNAPLIVYQNGSEIFRLITNGNVWVGGANIDSPSFLNLNVDSVQKFGLGGTKNVSYQQLTPGAINTDLGGTDSAAEWWRTLYSSNVVTPRAFVTNYMSAVSSTTNAAGSGGNGSQLDVSQADTFSYVNTGNFNVWFTNFTTDSNYSRTVIVGISNGNFTALTFSNRVGNTLYPIVWAGGAALQPSPTNYSIYVFQRFKTNIFGNVVTNFNSSLPF